MNLEYGEESIDVLSLALDNELNSLSFAVESVENLENIYVDLKRMSQQEYKELKTTVEITTNSIIEKLGIDKTNIAKESFNTDLEFAIEGVGSAISKGWDAVKKFFMTVWNAIKNFFAGVFKTMDGLKNKITELDDRLSTFKDGGEDKEFNNTKFVYSLGDENGEVTADIVTKKLDATINLVDNISKFKQLFRERANASLIEKIRNYGEWIKGLNEEMSKFHGRARAKSDDDGQGGAVTLNPYPLLGNKDYIAVMRGSDDNSSIRMDLVDSFDKVEDASSIDIEPANKNELNRIIAKLYTLTKKLEEFVKKFKDIEWVADLIKRFSPMNKDQAIEKTIMSIIKSIIEVSGKTSKLTTVVGTKGGWVAAQYVEACMAKTKSK